MLVYGRSIVKTILVIGIFCCQAIYADAQQPITVTIQPKTWVSSQRIYLKDVATINAPAHLSEKIANIYLTYAPKPGKSKTVKGDWIKSRIKSVDFIEELTLSVPESVEIIRASQVISEEDYLNYFDDYISQHIGAGVRYEISRFQVKGDSPLPTGRLSINVQRQPSVDLRGFVNLTASLLVNDVFVQRVSLSGWIDRFEDIICTTRPLERNHIIERRDVELRSRNVSKVKDTYYTRIEDIVGKRIKRKAGNGEIIFSSIIEIPPLIYKGNKVTIIAESNALIIKTTGIAQSDGYPGEQIRVKNAMSHKIIQATVVDETTVKVQY